MGAPRVTQAARPSSTRTWAMRLASSRSGALLITSTTSSAWCMDPPATARRCPGGAIVSAPAAAAARPGETSAMQECLFCRIGRGELPAHVIDQEDELVAFLDIQPVRAGHVLVIPREHQAYCADLPERL